MSRYAKIMSFQHFVDAIQMTWVIKIKRLQIRELQISSGKNVLIPTGGLH